MNHLDEGTIHAWLDGALDARQSADAQSHVSQCAECAAKVAEARGLIAASSRILTALDDVPGGVIPKPGASAPRRARRWASSGWMTALAAGLVLLALWRTTDVDRTAPSTMPDLRSIDSIVIPVPSVPAPVLAPAQPAPIPEAPRAQRPRGPIALGGARGETAPRPAEVARTDAPANAAAESRFADTKVSEAKDAIAAFAEPVSSWNGCYRVAAPTIAEDMVVTGVNEVNTSRARRAASERAPTVARAPSPAPAAATGAGAAAASAQKVATTAAGFLTIRIDSTAGQPRFNVRAADSSATPGRWLGMSGDSARISMIGRVPFVVTKRDRVACPE